MTDYIIPAWWDWMDHPEDEIPPGLLALACVRPCFGGGTEVIAGSMRGNTTIHTGKQAQAAARQHGANAVAGQLNKQQRRNIETQNIARRTRR